MDALLSACRLLGVDPDRVIKFRLEGDEAVVIVDNGIKGCPKYRVPLSDLPEPVTEAGDVNASPAAVKLAEQLGVNLADIEGTGAGGRILKRDVGV